MRDSPQVGVGLCIGRPDDGYGVIEVQSCWTGPRRSLDDPMIMTGWWWLVVTYCFAYKGDREAQLVQTTTPRQSPSWQW